MTEIEAHIDDEQSSGTEIERPHELTDLQRVIRALTSKDVEYEADPEATQRDIVTKILAAESFEDAMAEPEVVHARDVLERPFVFRGVRFWPSGYDQGAAVFAVADCVDTTTGEAVLLTCSAVRVLAKLVRAAMDDRWGWVGILHQVDRPTQGGYYPLMLETPEIRPVAATGEAPAETDSEPAAS